MEEEHSKHLLSFFQQRRQTRFTITKSHSSDCVLSHQIRKATPPIAIPTITHVDNPSEAGDCEDEVRGDRSPLLPEGFNGVPKIEGGSFE
ncbi:hypothetical protein Bca4012_013670 [Brassica carinata]|uniref:Uncharacterized protein n=1 Tax=Brassica carinata TaxID=52824 RepID=A0A8X7Q479_BRACI|nr:hypothetical protein Bca52824_068697 [Brassica carinata]